MNATLKNESPVGDTYTEKNPRFVPLGWGSLQFLTFREKRVIIEIISN